MKTFDEELRSLAARECVTETEETRERLDRATAVGERCAPEAAHAPLRPVWAAVCCALVLMIAGVVLWRNQPYAPDDLHAAAPDPVVLTEAEVYPETVENEAFKVQPFLFGYTSDRQLVVQWTVKDKREGCPPTLYLWKLEGMEGDCGTQFGAVSNGRFPQGFSVEEINRIGFDAVWTDVNFTNRDLTLTVLPVTLAQGILSAEQNASIHALAMAKTGDFPEVQALEELGLGKREEALSTTLHVDKNGRLGGLIWACGMGQMNPTMVGMCEIRDIMLRYAGAKLYVSFAAENFTDEPQALAWSMNAVEFLGSGEEQTLTLAAGETKTCELTYQATGEASIGMANIGMTWTLPETGEATQKRMMLASSDNLLPIRRYLGAAKADVPEITYRLLQTGVSHGKRMMLMDALCKDEQTLAEWRAGLTGRDAPLEIGSISSDGSYRRVESSITSTAGGWHILFLLTWDEEDTTADVPLYKDAARTELLATIPATDFAGDQVQEGTQVALEKLEVGYEESTGMLVAEFNAHFTGLTQGTYVIIVDAEGLPADTTAYGFGQDWLYISEEEASTRNVLISRAYGVPSTEKQLLNFRIRVWRVPEEIYEQKMETLYMSDDEKVETDPNLILIHDETLVGISVGEKDKAQRNRAYGAGTIQGVEGQGFASGEIALTWHGSVVTVDFDVKNTSDREQTILWSVPIRATEDYAQRDAEDDSVPETTLTLAAGETKHCHAVRMVRGNATNGRDIWVELRTAESVQTIVTENFELKNDIAYAKFMEKIDAPLLSLEVPAPEDKKVHCDVYLAQRVGNRASVLVDFTYANAEEARDCWEMYRNVELLPARLGDGEIRLENFQFYNDNDVKQHLYVLATCELAEGEDTAELFIGRADRVELESAGKITGFEVTE